MADRKPECWTNLDELYPEWIPQTLWTQFERSAGLFSDREFIIFEEGIYTYGQVLKHVNLMAKALLALGVAPGDHVAVCMFNCPTYIFLIFALSEIGAVKVPVNARLGKDEISYIFQHSEADFLITSKEDLLTICTQLPKLREIVVTQTDAFQRFLDGAERITDYELKKISCHCQDPFELSDIIYTSGSTSYPKGVMQTHDGILRNAYGTARCRWYPPGHRVFVPTPLCHVMAYIVGFLPCMFVGGTAVFTSRRFNPQHALDMMKLYHINDIVCMPIIMMKIISECKVNANDFPDFKAAYWPNGPGWLWSAVRKAFNLKYMANAYGMTECAANLTMISPMDDIEAPEKNNGRLMPGGVAGLKQFGGAQMQLRICDFETGRVLSSNQEGEIQFRGPMTTRGYYHDLKANGEAFTEDGWFRSKDIGKIDENGYLTFLGRNAENYKINGENISPQFLEKIIFQSPLVKDVACVGILHEKYGSIGVAFIDVWEFSEETTEKIKEHCVQHLATFQIPKYFYFSDSAAWPRTASNKVQKAELREYAAELIKENKMIKY